MLELILLLAVVACILAGGFFSGSETAFVSVDKPLLQARIQRGDRRALIAHTLLSAPARLLATTLVGTNICYVTATSLATLIVARHVPTHWHSPVTTACMVPLILIFAELLPKSIGRGNAQTFTLWAARPLAAAQSLMWPLVALVSGISIGLLRLFGIKEHPHTISVSREEVQALADLSVEQGVIGPTEHRMIRRVFELNHTPLSAAMVPLVELHCLPLSASPNELVERAAQSGHALFPVYEDAPTNIVGLVRLTDVLDTLAHTPTVTTLAPLVDRTIPFVPETKTVGAMLRDLQERPAPVVFVIDEYGGVSGMITIEKLVEEIAGELASDAATQRAMLAEHRGVLEADGRVDVDLIGERFGVTFDKEGYETIAGLVLKLTGHVPLPGETVRTHGLLITVIRATPKRIVRVAITRDRQAR
ncbi:MAG: hemolysin family protein [bacterium]|nr:hemolysin family protein [bacterium]